MLFVRVNYFWLACVLLLVGRVFWYFSIFLYISCWFDFCIVVGWPCVFFLFFVCIDVV